MSDTLYKYRIYCDTDSKWEYVWKLATESAPTTCPTNTGHTVNSNSVSIVEERLPNTVKVQDEITPLGFPPTGGNYRITSKAFDCPANQVSTTTFSFPYPVSIISGFMITEPDMKGDVLSVEAVNGATVGVIGANVAQNNTVITVNSTVLAYVKVGYHIRLTDGTNTTIYYEVISKDTNASTITLATGVSTAFSAATPTYVQMTVYYALNVEILYAGKNEMGANNTGATYVPPNTVFKLSYDNKSANIDKRACFTFELYY